MSMFFLFTAVFTFNMTRFIFIAAGFAFFMSMLVSALACCVTMLVLLSFMRAFGFAMLIIALACSVAVLILCPTSSSLAAASGVWAGTVDRAAGRTRTRTVDASATTGRAACAARCAT